MKLHSYSSYNIDLHYKKLRSKELRFQSDLSPEEKEEKEDLKEELTAGLLKFPKNQTISNFWDFLLVPTLVYELYYPRTRRCILYNQFQAMVLYGTRCINIFDYIHDVHGGG